MEKTENACDISGKRNPESSTANADKELTELSFYEKLIELNESSGLNLLFNVQETKFDLYFLYEEVTKRGGFYQVMKDGKWVEVESALNLRSSGFMIPEQFQKVYSEFLIPELQKVYEIYLLPFEQVYWKKNDGPSPCSDATFPGPSSCSTGKRKKAEEESKITDDTRDMNTGCKKVKSDKRKRKSLDVVDKESDARPTKPRTGYQIFLRLESHRLKMIRGENVAGNQKSRDMAVDAWNSLTEEGKKPYVDASKLDKERYEKELEEYNKYGGNNENATMIA